MDFSITMRAKSIGRSGMADLVVYANSQKDAEVAAEALANQWPNQEVKVWRRKFDDASDTVVWKHVSTEVAFEATEQPSITVVDVPLQDVPVMKIPTEYRHGEHFVYADDQGHRVFKAWADSGAEAEILFNMAIMHCKPGVLVEQWKLVGRGVKEDWKMIRSFTIGANE